MEDPADRTARDWTVALAVLHVQRERFSWAHHLPEDNLTTRGVATIPLPR